MRCLYNTLLKLHVLFLTNCMHSQLYDASINIYIRSYRWPRQYLYVIIVITFTYIFYNALVTTFNTPTYIFYDTCIRRIMKLYINIMLLYASERKFCDMCRKEVSCMSCFVFMIYSMTNVRYLGLNMYARIMMSFVSP